MPITDVSLLFDLKSLPIFCHFLRKWLCPCLFSPLQSGRFDREKTQAWLDKYAEGLDRLVASERYDTKDDFTVVIQPTLIQGSLPLLGNGNIDLNFLAPDCFHFSQRTHALGKINTQEKSHPRWRANLRNGQFGEFLKLVKQCYQTGQF